ncbi:hypothetical protein ACGFIF_39800 [Kribbella sp. NPDC049174]|uniref:hypothetical protein n=1 Tax=Kribbella sp. NPDC049174 TaxID=3364112 RepID=UPI0037220236
MSPIRTRLITMAALGTVLITGCGSSEPDGSAGAAPSTTRQSAAPPSTPAASIADLTAQQILKKAGAAVRAAVSVRVRGPLAVEDGPPMAIDVGMTNAGSSGTITMDGAALEVLVIGQTAYVQPSDAYWRQTVKPKSAADKLIKQTRGRWIKAKLTDEGFGQTASFASKATFFDSTFDGDHAVRKVGPRTIGGILCVGLGKDGEGIAWLDAGTARLIQLDQPAPTASITFTEYDQVKAPKAPPKAQVIDGKTLGL